MRKILSSTLFFLLIVLFPGTAFGANLPYTVDDVIQYMRTSTKPQDPLEQKKYDTYYVVKKIEGSTIVVDHYEKTPYGMLFVDGDLPMKSSDLADPTVFQLSSSSVGASISALNAPLQTSVSSSVSNKVLTVPNKLQVFGDIKVGSQNSSGCIQGYDGTTLVGTCVSDQRLKQDIQPFQDTLDRLVQLRPVTYQYRASEFPEFGFGSTKQYGLIAQETEPYLPELVADNVKDGFKGINYHLLPIYLLQGLKELDVKVERSFTSTTLVTVADGIVFPHITVENLVVTQAAEFRGTLAVEDHVEFGGDTVGQAKIRTGMTEVVVQFARPYERVPVVVATAVDYDAPWKLLGVSTTQFVLQLPRSLADDIIFNWHAFMPSAEAQVVVSAPADQQPDVVVTPVVIAPEVSTTTPEIPEQETLTTSTPIDSTPAETTQSISPVVSSTPTEQPSVGSDAPEVPVVEVSASTSGSTAGAESATANPPVEPSELPVSPEPTPTVNSEPAV